MFNIQVIAKHVEGLGTSYITGSGETLKTKCRVHIYETEGNILPKQRNKRKRTDSDYKSSSPICPVTPVNCESKSKSFDSFPSYINNDCDQFLLFSISELEDDSYNTI